MELKTNKEDREKSPDSNSTRDDSKPQHNKFEFGGPLSAFSSLYRQDGDETLNSTKQITGFYTSDTQEKIGGHILQTNLFNNNAGIFQDIPVAPAFAQICK